MMERQSLTAGTAVLYAAHPDSITSAARTVLSSRRVDLQLQSRPDTATTMILGGRPMGLLSNGEWIRFVITPTTRDTALVRLVVRSGYLLGSAKPGRTPLLFQALDARLDPRAVLVPGTRIRLQGARPGLGTLLGEFRRWGRDSLVLERHDGTATSVALGELARVSVMRGEYNHISEFGAIGSLLGYVVGLGLPESSTSDDWFGLERLKRAMGGAVIGMVAGAFLGSLARTPVWSDVDVTRLRRGPLQ